jgi:hypothetical protein
MSKPRVKAKVHAESRIERLPCGCILDHTAERVILCERHERVVFREIFDAYRKVEPDKK